VGGGKTLGDRWGDILAQRTASTLSFRKSPGNVYRRPSKGKGGESDRGTAESPGQRLSVASGISWEAKGANLKNRAGLGSAFLGKGGQVDLLNGEVSWLV